MSGLHVYMARHLQLFCVLSVLLECVDSRCVYSFVWQMLVFAVLLSVVSGVNWQGWLMSRSAYRPTGHADKHYITTHCLSQQYSGVTVCLCWTCV
jgi:hypothetical protein